MQEREINSKYASFLESCGKASLMEARALNNTASKIKYHTRYWRPYEISKRIAQAKKEKSGFHDQNKVNKGSQRCGIITWCLLRVTKQAFNTIFGTQFKFSFCDKVILVCFGWGPDFDRVDFGNHTVISRQPISSKHCLEIKCRLLVRIKKTIWLNKVELHTFMFYLIDK